jgi:hypothetical protein
MIISTGKRFVFAAFNKTGSTSLEKILKPYNNRLLYQSLKLRYKWQLNGDRVFKHVRPYHIKLLLGEEKWANYFSFAFVRNPWSRTVSLYCYHRKMPEEWHLTQKGFREWVLAGGTGTVKRSMSDFIRDDEGNDILSYVGRFESLDDDFLYICEKINVQPAKLPHLNRATLGNYRDYYDDETRDLIQEWCRQDIETFGYEF